MKGLKVQHYVCNSCGYSQGHQIIYCPKCPSKMTFRTETQYDDFRRDKQARNCLYYKDLCMKLNKGKYINWDIWDEIVKKVKSNL